MTLTAKKLPGNLTVKFAPTSRAFRFLIDLVFSAEYAFVVPLGGVDGALARAL